MAKYTILVKSIVENIWDKQNKGEPPEIITSAPIVNGTWENGFNTEYISPFDSKRDPYPSVNEMIEDTYQSIFNFTFPMYNSDTKEISTDMTDGVHKRLCFKIIKAYYMREIGFETIGLWQLQLDNVLNRIMPYYNELYKSNEFNLENPLENYDIYDNSERNTTSSGNSNTNAKGSGETNVKNVFEDTPSSKLGNEDYATNITTQNTSSSDASNATTEDERTSKDLYGRHAHGLTNYSKQDMIASYRDNIINIDEAIIGELRDLFMLLY